MDFLNLSIHLLLVTYIKVVQETTYFLNSLNPLKFFRLTTSLLTYSLLFNMEKLSGSIYMNSIIMGSFRYALNLITAVSDMKFKWLGRKLVHSIAEGFIMLALLFFITIYMLGLFLIVGLRDFRHFKESWKNSLSLKRTHFFSIGILALFLGYHVE